MNSLCIRCGKERVAQKSWDEVVEAYGRTSTITHTQFVCTDPKCQVAVDAQLQAQKEQRTHLENQKELDKRARMRQRSKNAAKARLKS